MMVTLLDQQSKLYFIFLLIIPFFGFLQAQNSNVTWKAGTASISITTKQSMWISGYALRNHSSEGVRQDVWIKALALEDQNGERGVMVSMDLCLLSKELSDRIRGALKLKYGLDRSG